MGMTIAEKILADHLDREEVTPSEVVTAEIDAAMVNDLTAPLTFDALEELGAERVWDPENVTVVFDHQFPPTTIDAAEEQESMRNLSHKYGISNLYDTGEGFVIS